MPENIEVFFPVGVAVSRVVGADYLVLEDLLCSFERQSASRSDSVFPLQV